MNIIGDIAGEYDAFMRLLKIMPQGRVVAAGDINDRGKDSRKVMDWFMEGRGDAIMGNHDLLFFKYARGEMRFGDFRNWVDSRNGGGATLANFSRDDVRPPKIPGEYVEWCARRPYMLEFNSVVITHAPLPHVSMPVSTLRRWRDEFSKAEWLDLWRQLVWHTHAPERAEKYSVFGHLGKQRAYADEKGEYAMCIDDCHNGQLAGLHWETRTVYRVPLEA